MKKNMLKRKANVKGTMQRAALFTAASLDQEARTVSVIVSTETPVRSWRWDIGEFWEILDHKPESIDFEFFGSGRAPFAKDHDLRQQIGVVVSAELKGRELHAVNKYSRKQIAEDEYQDAIDGIRNNISVGYDVLEYVLEKPATDTEIPTYRAIKWVVYENSTVPIGADINAHLRAGQIDEAAQPKARIMQRSADGGLVDYKPETVGSKQNTRSNVPKSPETPKIQEERTMDEKLKAALVRLGMSENSTDEQAIAFLAGLDERQKAAIGLSSKRAEAGVELVAMAARAMSFVPDAQARVSKAIASLTDDNITETVSAFRAEMSELVMKASDVAPHVVNLGLSRKEEKQFSMLRAIQAFDGDTWQGGNSFEREVSDECAKILKRDAKGFYLPTELQVSHKRAGAFSRFQGLAGRSAAVAGIDADGGYTVQTDVMSIIEILRNKLLTVQLGANLLTGLQGNLSFPRQIGTPTFNWFGEDGGAQAATDITGYFGAIPLSPKNGNATIPYSRQLLAQSSEDIESFFRMDLLSEIAQAVDFAAMFGPSGGDSPVGIANTPGVQIVSMGDPDGGTLTRSKVIEFETLLSNGNADIGNLAFVTNSKVRGAARNTLVDAGSGKFLYNALLEMPGFGEMIGYLTGVTNQVPSDLTEGASIGICSAMIFGNWNDLMIADWGAIDVIVDPLSRKKEGIIELTASALADSAPRRASSFVVSKDILTP